MDFLTKRLRVSWLEWDLESCGEKNPPHMENHTKYISSHSYLIWMVIYQDFKPKHPSGGIDLGMADVNQQWIPDDALRHHLVTTR